MLWVPSVFVSEGAPWPFLEKIGGLKILNIGIFFKDRILGDAASIRELKLQRDFASPKFLTRKQGLAPSPLL